MTIGGLTPEAPRYQEPNPDSIVRVLRIDDWGQEVLRRTGYRLRMIDGDELEYEPIQQDVTSYPPVKVTEKPGPPPDISRLVP